MLHYSLQAGGISPINDDAGLVGIPIFDGLKFDSTAGGLGQTRDILIFVFNDDTNFHYVNPIISLSGADPVLTILLPFKNILSP